MIATYLLSTSLKSVSGMKLHRDLNINQRSAWFLAHRLRTTLAQQEGIFSGLIEVDETYTGGRRANMPKVKRSTLEGRGAVGKTAVVGAKDRATKAVAARVVPDTKADTLQGFVAEHATPDATIYTDEASAYESLPFDHETVKHPLEEYVRATCMPTVSSLCGHVEASSQGTFHKMSPKHPDRYIQEFAVRRNLRDEDTINIMAAVATGMNGKRLRHADLIADNGLDSGARC